MAVFFIFRTFEEIAKSKDLLMQYVTETLPGYEIKHVAGDGLCILRSFKEAVKAVSDITVSIEDLQLYLRREILHRFEFYREFLTETCDLLKELDIFLSNPLKFYNSEVVDIFLLALGNAYDVNTVVLQSNVDKCWTTDLSNTKNNFTTNSYFAKSLYPHVDPIIPNKDKESDDDTIMTHYVPPSILKNILVNFKLEEKGGM